MWSAAKRLRPARLSIAAFLQSRTRKALLLVLGHSYKVQQPEHARAWQTSLGMQVQVVQL